MRLSAAGAIQSPRDHPDDERQEHYEREHADTVHDQVTAGSGSAWRPPGRHGQLWRTREYYELRRVVVALPHVASVPRAEA